MPVRRVREQEHGLEQSLDWTTIVPACEPALERGEKVVVDLPIRNVNRTVGTILGSEVTRRHGPAGLADDTIQDQVQRFGRPELRRVRTAAGSRMTLEGDANDYVGKGLSGGKIIVFPPKTARSSPRTTS